ncbi:hypothetical protein [Hymenobacter armeniacus]|uniref:Uncharacterized protein n=1 Tax=Hymenobacter armeniacus TaxID=2771358 RepID=A0ABR8JRY9_9BACT|nr:hypothetical protein [Hymenobacter armeniacus]MBD2722736.1 hypothetical protein [Hymenobacter armeniacus]
MRYAPFFILGIFLVAAGSAIGKCDKSLFSIVLLGGFSNDRVEIIVDNKKVFDRIVTSDGSTELAGSCSFKKSLCRQKVIALVNGHQMRIIYLDHTKISNQLLGLWKHEKSISTSFYKIPLVLE